MSDKIMVQFVLALQDEQSEQKRWRFFEMTRRLSHDLLLNPETGEVLNRESVVSAGNCFFRLERFGWQGDLKEIREFYAVVDDTLVIFVRIPANENAEVKTKVEQALLNNDFNELSESIEGGYQSRQLFYERRAYRALFWGNRLKG